MALGMNSPIKFMSLCSINLGLIHSHLLYQLSYRGINFKIYLLEFFLILFYPFQISKNFLFFVQKFYLRVLQNKSVQMVYYFACRHSSHYGLLPASATKRGGPANPFWRGATGEYLQQNLIRKDIPQS